MAKKRKRPKLNQATKSRRKIYRIQDKEGRGPWRPGFSSCWVEDRPASVYRELRPIMIEFPNVLSQVRREFNLGVGCTSLKQLQRWVTASEWRTLRKLGFDCFVLEPDRIVVESATQCFFESRQPLHKYTRRVRLYAR